MTCTRQEKNKQILCRGGTELTILVVMVVSWTHNQEEVRVQIDVDDAKQKKKLFNPSAHNLNNKLKFHYVTQ